MRRKLHGADFTCGDNELSGDCSLLWNAVSFYPPGGTYRYAVQSGKISTSTAGADLYYILVAGDPDILYNGDRA
jgi:hypothetical protein